MLFESLKKYLKKVWNGIDPPCYGKFLIFYETFPKFYTITKFHKLYYSIMPSVIIYYSMILTSCA